MSLIHKRLSDLNGEELTQAVLERFRIDYDFREESLDGLGYETAEVLFEARSTDTDEDGIPRVNLIRRAVLDYLAVTLPNIPSAQLYAHRNIPGRLPEWERDIRMEAINQTEIVMNAYIKTILKDNEYNDLVQDAVVQSAVFGVGFLLVDIDRSNDIRESMELREILAKEVLSPEDMDRLEVLQNKIRIRHVDTRDVYLEGGKRKFDDNMHRASVIERFSTLLLREEYGDKVDHPELIAPGKFPHGVDDHVTEDRYDDTQTAVLTMWELEPVEKARMIEGPDGEEVEIPFTDWNLVKVVIAGGQLVEKEITTGLPDPESDEEAGPLRLPLVAFYLNQSVNHPYGFSIPLMLALSEQFINSMRAIIYKSAKKAVSTQGVIVAIPNLGDGDLEELNYVLEEGGVGHIKGNTQGPIDIRDMVMPLNYNAAPINPALMQALSMEMQMFGNQSQAVDPDELKNARTGAAKRAQMSASDRPKALSMTLLSPSVEKIHESVYELVRIFHTKEIGVEIEVPGGGRQFVVLNEVYRRNVMVQDSMYATPDNPRGFALEPIELTLNSTGISMYAEAEGRGKLPLDMIARFQILIALQQVGAITPETVRRIGLDEEIREMDDHIRRQQEQQMMNQMLMQTMMMDDPAMQRASANALGQPQGLGILPGDMSRDARDETGQIAQSAFAQPVFG